MLSIDTGYARSYDINPYLEYENTPDVIFPVRRKKSDCKIPEKARVVAVEVDGNYRAYPLSVLKKAGRVRDVLGSRSLEIVYEPASDSARVLYENGNGSGPPTTLMYWFAWHAFHPDTDCYRKR